MSSQEIKKCPSCRGAARVCQHTISAVRCWVQCDACHMRGPLVDTDADAIVMWNALPRRRPTIDHNPSARAPGGGYR